MALDDDDTVLAHYVSTYKAAAADNDGRVLRTVAVRQDVAPVGADDLRAVSVGDPFRPFPMDFNLIDHLVTNYSPIMTIAFPRGGFHDLGLRFDESLDTTEDWDLVVRTAAVLGVASVREVTSVYRWWVHTGASSRELHTKEEWAAARTKVQQAFEKTVLLLSPEETRRMIAALERARADSDKSNRKARELATSQHEVILRMEEVRIAHDRAVEDVQLLSERAQAAHDRVQEVREKMRKRHANHLEMLREADTLLAERPDLRPSGSIVDLPPEELKALVRRLRTEPRQAVVGTALVSLTESSSLRSRTRRRPGAHARTVGRWHRAEESQAVRPPAPAARDRSSFRRSRATSRSWPSRHVDDGVLLGDAYRPQDPPLRRRLCSMDTPAPSRPLPGHLRGGPRHSDRGRPPGRRCGRIPVSRHPPRTTRMRDRQTRSLVGHDLLDSRPPDRGRPRATTTSVTSKSTSSWPIMHSSDSRSACVPRRRRGSRR